MSIVPSLPILHEGDVPFNTNEGACGASRIIDPIDSHPIASVTVTWNVSAGNPVLSSNKKVLSSAHA